MANNYMIYDAVFEPYTYDSMVKPIAILNDAHNAIEDNYAKLIEESSIWERLKDSPLDKDLYDRYKAFDDAAMAAYMKFNEEGLTGNSRLDLHKIRKDYRQQILPIVAADSARAALIQARDAAREKDRSVRFENDPADTPLSYYIDNPTTTLGASYSGEELRKIMATEAKNFKTLPNVFSTFYNELGIPYSEQIDGLLAGDLTEILSDEALAGASEEVILLRNLINRIADTAVQEWGDPEKKAIARREAIEFAKKGIYEALGTAKYHQVNVPSSGGKGGSGKETIPTKNNYTKRYGDVLEGQLLDEVKVSDEVYSALDEKNIAIKAEKAARDAGRSYSMKKVTTKAPNGIEDTHWLTVDFNKYTKDQQEDAKNILYNKIIDYAIDDYKGFLLEDGISYEKDPNTGLINKVQEIINPETGESSFVHTALTPEKAAKELKKYHDDNRRYRVAGTSRYTPNILKATREKIVGDLLTRVLSKHGANSEQIKGVYLFDPETQRKGDPIYNTSDTFKFGETSLSDALRDLVPGITIEEPTLDDNITGIEDFDKIKEKLDIIYHAGVQGFLIHPKGLPNSPASIVVEPIADYAPDEIALEKITNILKGEKYVGRNGNILYRGSEGDIKGISAQDVADALFAAMFNEQVTSLEAKGRNISIPDRKKSISKDSTNINTENNE